MDFKGKSWFLEGSYISLAVTLLILNIAFMVEHQAKFLEVEHHLDLVVFVFWALLIISELIGLVGFFSKDSQLSIIHFICNGLLIFAPMAYTIYWIGREDKTGGGRDAVLSMFIMLTLIFKEIAGIFYYYIEKYRFSTFKFNASNYRDSVFNYHYKFSASKENLHQQDENVTYLGTNESPESNDNEPVKIRSSLSPDSHTTKATKTVSFSLAEEPTEKISAEVHVTPAPMKDEVIEIEKDLKNETSPENKDVETAEASSKNKDVHITIQPESDKKKSVSSENLSHIAGVISKAKSDNLCSAELINRESFQN